MGNSVLFFVHQHNFLFSSSGGNGRANATSADDDLEYDQPGVFLSDEAR